MTAHAGLRSRAPSWILEGLPSIDRAKLAIDMIAGATLSALAIPEVVGYTKIAGMPVVAGLGPSPAT